MYTLKIESINEEFLKAAQATIQENGLWAYSIEVGEFQTAISLATMDIRQLKRFVDLLEYEEFMRYE